MRIRVRRPEPEPPRGKSTEQARLEALSAEVDAKVKTALAALDRFVALKENRNGTR